MIGFPPLQGHAYAIIHSTCKLCSICNFLLVGLSLTCTTEWVSILSKCMHGSWAFLLLSRSSFCLLFFLFFYDYVTSFPVLAWQMDERMVALCHSIGACMAIVLGHAVIKSFEYISFFTQLQCHF